MRFLLFLLGLLPLIASAQTDTNVIPGFQMPARPQIDGKVEASEWQGVPTFSGLLESDTAQPAPYNGTFYLAYDSEFIYFAAVLPDPDPRTIQANEYATNVNLGSDDHVTLSLDPFGALSNFNSFRINPAGATQLTIAGGRAPKREWIGEFVAAARITESGWEAEAKIPWRLMNLPGPGVRTLRFNVNRFVVRTRRTYAWRDPGDNAIEGLGKWENVAVPAIRPDRAIKLLPYSYFGYDPDRGTIFNSGLDLKTPLTDQIDLVGTINPDFRNIENQVLSLDFSYFERIAGESRPFFLEGRQFRSVGGDAGIFASQRIRQFDTGVNTYGRLDPKTRFSVLNTIDFGEQNAFVGTLSHSPTPRSGIDLAVISNRQRGRNNDTAYLSGSQGSGDYIFYGSLAMTRDTTRNFGRRFNVGTFYGVGGLDANLEFVHVSPDYFPRLGFAPQRNFQGLSAFLSWDRLHPRGAIAETEISFEGSDLRRVTGGPYRRAIAVQGSLTGRDGSDLDIGYRRETILGFQDELFSVNVEKPRGNSYRSWEVEYLWGHLSGRRYQSAEARISYRPVRRWQLNLSASAVRHFENREQIILTTNFDLDRERSISGRLVQEDDDLNFYLSFRRAGNIGPEYFVILGDPNARTFRPSIVLKAVVPLRIGR